MSTKNNRTIRELATGLGFLTPNILGFLTFTTIPLVFSMVMAFSNWDLKLHNMFKPDNHVHFVGISNFVRLLSDSDSYKYLGNTLFLMMGIPFSIGGALISALLLSRDLRGGSRKTTLMLIASAALVVSCIMLMIVGAGASAMTILICGLACAFLFGGTLGGSTVYRTLFYLPSFTAGVATFLLWKKLYNPISGPINQTLNPILDKLTTVVNGTPSALIQGGLWLAIIVVGIILFWGLYKLNSLWRDGDLGSSAIILPTLFLMLPSFMALQWFPTLAARYSIAIVAGALLAVNVFMMLSSKQEFACKPTNGFGNALMLCMFLMVLQFVFVGLGIVAYNLPALSAITTSNGVSSGGLTAPDWLTSYHWAKPAIMMMGFWGAIGSNNMLLYLAALTNVPGELYEAADIDGASPFQKFWNVTWPQLAPTTFFIVVMAMIGGLQGGFEMARTMTQGGPAGATTTLSYSIYTEGFVTGRLGYSSSFAWVLFAMVFSITMFNWKFGSRYVND
jgi:multiple sugar transport system permease protein